MIGDWLREAGKSEIVRDLVDAIVELFNVLMDLIEVFAELCGDRLSDFFKGMDKTQPIYSFRDAVKAVVRMITDMIRGVSDLIRGLKDLFEMMKDNQIFKEFWKGIGEVAGFFFDIVMKALGAVGRLGQALMALVRGDWRVAKRLAGSAVDLLFGDSKAEASGNFDLNGDEPTGQLSTRHEGGVGTVSSGEGDPYGGISYGAFQFSSKIGIADQFVGWLRDQGHRFGDLLSEAGIVNSEGFKDTWRGIADSDPEEFFKLQQEFARKYYYENTANNILESTGIDVSKMSRAMKEVVWSTGVHHGAGGATSIFKAALRDAGDNASEDDLLKHIYEQRYLQSDSAVRDSFIPRFQTELAEALEMLRQERENKVKKREKKEKEVPQYEFRNPPADMREPTWWDYAKEWALNGVEELGNNIIDFGGWLWDKSGEIGEEILGTSSDDNMNLSEKVKNTAARIDPVMLNRLMGGAASAYSQSYGGTDIKNINYQITVGDVIVSKTDAAPQEIGQAVADETLTRLQSNVNQVASNRVFSGVTWT